MHTITTLTMVTVAVAEPILTMTADMDLAAMFAMTLTTAASGIAAVIMIPANVISARQIIR